MTYRSIPLSFSFGVMACVFVFVALTISVTFNSHAQESSGEGNSVEGSDQQLKNTLQQIGIGPERNGASETDRSWTDRFSNLFGEPEDEVGEPTARELPEDTTSESTSETVDTESNIEDDAVVISTSTQESASAISSDPIVQDAEITTSTSVQEHDDSKPVLSEEPPLSAALSLDTLLRQSSQSNHVHRETFYARLEERRRLAIALRTTLEAAEEVAAFGQAGPQLLQDATLDTIVATMVADLEREQREEEETATQLPTAPNLTYQVSTDEPVVTDPSGFEVWRPVYIVQDVRGNRVGWRNLLTGERLITYVGETSMFDGDTVKTVAVSSDSRGRFLILDVNDERHELHFF